MIIDLRKHPAGPQDYHLVLEKDWWTTGPKNDQISALATPLEVRIRIYRAGEKFVIEGVLTGDLELRCDRCLESFQRRLKRTFREYLSLPAPEPVKTEVELTEEDIEVDFLRGEEIDLDDIVREQIYLSLPFQSLCSPQCAGLCPMCGKNLNQGDCGCERRRGHPEFAKLKNLRLKGDNS